MITKAAHLNFSGKTLLSGWNGGVDALELFAYQVRQL
jgi:hypothetical protein